MSRRRTRFDVAIGVASLAAAAIFAGDLVRERLGAGENVRTPATIVEIRQVKGARYCDVRLEDAATVGRLAEREQSFHGPLCDGAVVGQSVSLYANARTGYVGEDAVVPPAHFVGAGLLGLFGIWRLTRSLRARARD